MSLIPTAWYELIINDENHPVSTKNKEKNFRKNQIFLKTRIGTHKTVDIKLKVEHQL